MREEKAIIEAALFASGDPIDEGKLQKLVKKKDVRGLILDLMNEYEQRNSALEIKEIDGKYVMQVRPEYAENVRPIAPKELRSPVLRTLSIIAYHQPLTQSELVDRRGQVAYEHVREIEEKGLIASIPRGRTRLLQTTPRFAEYFNLDPAGRDPEAIKRKIIELAREQNMGLDKWLGKQGLGVTPMYESLVQLCGIRDYEVVNPYDPDDEERDMVMDLGVLVVSKGYGERISRYFDGKVIEVAATTFEDLISSIHLLSEYGSQRKVKESVELIKELKDDYVEKAYHVTEKVAPMTEMVSRMVNELGLGISPDGIKVAPDYGTSGDGKEIGAGADILVPTHKNAETDVVKRICHRYDILIEGLKMKKKD